MSLTEEDFWNLMMNSIARACGVPVETLPKKDFGQQAPLVFADGYLVKMSKDGKPIAVTHKTGIMPALENGEYWKSVSHEVWSQYRLSLPLI